MDGRGVNLRATMETQGFRWKRHCGEKHTANSVYSDGPRSAQSTLHAHDAARGGAHTYGRTCTSSLHPGHCKWTRKEQRNERAFNMKRFQNISGPARTGPCSPVTLVFRVPQTARRRRHAQIPALNNRAIMGWDEEESFVPWLFRAGRQHPVSRFYLIFKTTCVRVCVYAHACTLTRTLATSKHAEVREQSAGVSSLLPPCRVWELNSGHHALASAFTP